MHVCRVEIRGGNGNEDAERNQFDYHQDDVERRAYARPRHQHPHHRKRNRDRGEIDDAATVRPNL